MSWLGKWLSLFRRQEAGSATVEFVLTLPAVIFIFFAAMESGLYMTRNVLFDRAVSMAMRDLQVGLIVDPDKEDNLKKAICSRAVMLEDCMTALKLELTIISTATWQFPTTAIECIDRRKPIKPPLTLKVGVQNDIMLVRACITVDAIFPTTGIAAGLPKDDKGYYIVSMSGFVNEP